MPHLSSPRRLTLVALALLAGCAASGSEGAPSLAAAPPLPTGAFGPYLAGRFAVTETDTRIAADELLRALQAEPQQDAILTTAFLATVMDGRPDANRLARRLPDNQIAALLLVGADAQAGRWDRAENRLRQLPRQGVAGLLHPLLTAWVQQGRGATDQALATLRPLIESGRLRGTHALHAAIIADIANRPREAERFIRTALAETPDANLRLISIAAGILARAGREAEGQRLLDLASAGSDELALAFSPASRRQILGTRTVATAVEGMAEAQLALAAALRGQGAGEFGLVLARLSLRLRPEFAPALMLISDVLAEERHPDTALAALDAIAATDPLAPVAALRRAALLDRLDRTADAERVLTELAAAEPASPQPLARLGDIFRARNRYPDAVLAYDGALARIPNPGPAEWPLFYARGISEERAGHWTRAERDFTRALELAPEQPNVLNYLGYTWVERGANLAEARRMLERAAALRPQDGNIADSLGWALYKIGDLPNAVTWLEKAAELESRSSVINDHLGDAFWASGRQAEARFQWRRALITDPEPGDVARIDAKLREGLPPTSTPTAQREVPRPAVP
ncbi:tetratricopeptide repeat protein [Humitalea rosea]|uniref:Tetratricopeptide repeat protein n=1 Tax=Humitalea rosea TaxID=990373 RepID=A0A2W7ITI2_9PROT|nr:tetratricopeptide repeat protein [Humitalea rosea]PZW51111.1 tetratricopeptide repeat protein [Humitalea rosea]